MLVVRLSGICRLFADSTTISCYQLLSIEIDTGRPVSRHASPSEFSCLFTLPPSAVRTAKMWITLPRLFLFRRMGHQTGRNSLNRCGLVGCKAARLCLQSRRSLTTAMLASQIARARAIVCTGVQRLANSCSTKATVAYWSDVVLAPALYCTLFLICFTLSSQTNCCRCLF